MLRRFITTCSLVLLLASSCFPGYADTVSVPADGTANPISPTLNKIPLNLAIAGLLMIPLDNALVKNISRTPYDQHSDALTEFANSFGDPMILLPAIGGMYLLGDKNDKDTAKLALSALVNAGIMTGGLKIVTGRARPRLANDEGEFTGPETRAGCSSFPSGHTASAFAVATVLANKHPKQKWLYYGLATTVGIARIRKSAHYPSDVLVGAGIGIYAGNNALKHGPGILFKF